MCLGGFRVWLGGFRVGLGGFRVWLGGFRVGLGGFRVWLLRLVGNYTELSRRGLIFPGKFLESDNFKWGRFPKEFLEMYVRAKREAQAPTDTNKGALTGTPVWSRIKL